MTQPAAALIAGLYRDLPLLVAPELACIGLALAILAYTAWSRP